MGPSGRWEWGGEKGTEARGAGLGSVRTWGQGCTGCGDWDAGIFPNFKEVRNWLSGCFSGQERRQEGGVGG